MDKKERFRLNLAKARYKKGLTAYRLSKLLNKDNTYINKIENGVNLPSLEMLYKIIKILEIDANELFNLK